VFKEITSFGLRAAALVVIQFIAYAFASGIVAAAGFGLPAPKDQSLTAQMLLLMCLLNGVILGLLIRRSTMSGVRLIALVFCLVFGVQTAMSQLETLYFNSVLGIPERQLIGIITSGAITAVLTSIGAVLLFRRRWTISSAIAKGSQKLSSRQWSFILPPLSAVYVVVYFIFGYFVAWQFTDVRTFYSHSSDILSFPAHMLNFFRTDSWLLVFQAFRGVLWVGLALVVLAITGGRAWIDALLTGGVFAVLLTSQLLIPNPYMGETIRMAHLLETSTSTFIFGVATVWLVGSKSGKASKTVTTIAW